MTNLVQSISARLLAISGHWTTNAPDEMRSVAPIARLGKKHHQAQRRRAAAAPLFVGSTTGRSAKPPPAEGGARWPGNGTR